jgi:hypothetical protein
MEAGEHTQRTVAALSQQLRRFLDDRAWLENRRIMDILHGIESKALALRDAPPRAARWRLPRPARTSNWRWSALYLRRRSSRSSPIWSCRPAMTRSILRRCSNRVVDKARLTRHIRHALQDRMQITLSELVATQLEHGLAELVAYLQLGSETFVTVVDENTVEPIRWQAVAADGVALTRCARLPRVVFMR